MTYALNQKSLSTKSKGRLCLINAPSIHFTIASYCYFQFNPFTPFFLLYILYLNDFTAKHDVYKVTAIVDTRFKSAQLH